MKIDLFTLCEGAFNTNGRLTIVNTFEDIIAPSYPWKGPLGMALKILVKKEEAGEHDLKVSIKPVTGDKMLHEMNAHLNLPVEKATNDIRVAMATNIQGLLVPSPGDYVVEVVFDGIVLGSFPFKALTSNGK